MRSGGIVAFPTETVYGLGADAFNPEAVARIFAAKNRPADNPLIVHLARKHQLSDVARHVPETAHQLISTFFPGPLTVVLQRSQRLPLEVTAGLDTVAVRMPAHALAQQFLSECNRPVAAPSANRSGRPSATNWNAVHFELGGHIDAILQGTPPTLGIESTVVDCTRTPPVLLRPGAVTVEQLQTVIPSLLTASEKQDNVAHSPGMRHRHYAPDTRVVLVDLPDTAEPHRLHAYIGLEQLYPPEAFGLCYIAPDEAAYAQTLYDFFRQCEKCGIRIIYCQTTTDTGIGRALMDRLRRAAE